MIPPHTVQWHLVLTASGSADTDFAGCWYSSAFFAIAQKDLPLGMWIAHSVWHSHRKYRVSLHRACARHSSLSAHLAPRHSPSNLHPQLTLHAVQTWATASPLAILLPILGSVHEGQELLRKSTVASSFFPPAGGLEPENVLSVEGGPAFPSPALPALDLALLYPADGLCQAKCPLSPFCASLASLFAL